MTITILQNTLVLVIKTTFLKKWKEVAQLVTDPRQLTCVLKKMDLGQQ